MLRPDVDRPIGGVKQMHRLAESLVRCGREATLIQDNDSFHPGGFESQVKTIGIAEWYKLRKDGVLNVNDVVVFPETYIHHIDDYARDSCWFLIKMHLIHLVCPVKLVLPTHV